jgi:hypothetical protein
MTKAGYIKMLIAIAGQLALLFFVVQQVNALAS